MPQGLFAAEATFGRCASKTEWVYGFKVGLSITPAGVITTFCLAEAASNERPIGEILIHNDRHAAYLADKGFTSIAWERHWFEDYGAIVAATPKDNSKRAWDEAARLWASGKRQVIEGVINQLKDQFFLEHHRAKTLEGFWRVLRRRSPPTPADNISTSNLVVRFIIWPICWSEKLCISRLRHRRHAPARAHGRARLPHDEPQGGHRLLRHGHRERGPHARSGGLRHRRGQRGRLRARGRPGQVGCHKAPGPDDPGRNSGLRK
ncbi:hypothetical protein E0L93_10360 [Rubrobacter taiwanensis]|uniref:Transposase DDE domain-containing protein n=1 Tax=Rubrobacter taiwanensis TaxID=185139 RepID=A0A4R1BGF2_9ACTN|nr:hypothetical protein E0L93_10360 [Rubrobacter taiwanensis]